MTDASRMMLFDNLDQGGQDDDPNRFEFPGWSGQLADVEWLESWTFQRAADVRRDLSRRHLAYAPEFLKWCESECDLGVFYIATPQLGTRTSLSIWQSLGYFWGRRHFDAHGQPRPLQDTIVICEGGIPSNLYGFASIHVSKATSLVANRAEYHQAIIEQITDLVVGFINENENINGPNRLLNDFVKEHFWEAEDPSKINQKLSRNGYAFAQRACDLQRPAVMLAAHSRRLILRHDDLLAAMEESHSMHRLIKELAAIRRGAPAILLDSIASSAMRLKFLLRSLDGDKQRVEQDHVADDPDSSLYKTVRKLLNRSDIPVGQLDQATHSFLRHLAKLAKESLNLRFGVLSEEQWSEFASQILSFSLSLQHEAREIALAASEIRDDFQQHSRVHNALKSTASRLSKV